ncbi:unnamed protein product [Rangifer tarandus platyrhynchus]|uniref:Uncharacterized protein n=1 Tax=Rangifer tarandus platyrhynchus TaxID=3082113 RepID=A0ABN8YC83_RANTA|nr:unnamed protein product [Rangifer tarandus platyrhynchus]
MMLILLFIELSPVVPECGCAERRFRRSPNVPGTAASEEELVWSGPSRNRDRTGATTTAGGSQALIRVSEVRFPGHLLTREANLQKLQELWSTVSGSRFFVTAQAPLHTRTASHSSSPAPRPASASADPEGTLACGAALRQPSGGGHLGRAGDAEPGLVTGRAEAGGGSGPRGAGACRRQPPRLQLSRLEAAASGLTHLARRHQGKQEQAEGDRQRDFKSATTVESSHICRAPYSVKTVFPFI